MTVDPSVVPGLLLLLAEVVALAGIGYVIVRVALRETDQRVALAQGLVVGPAIWGVVVNLIMYALPGMAGAIAGWVFVVVLAAVLVWRAAEPVRPCLRTSGAFILSALALFWIALASRQAIGIADAHTHLGLAASIRAGIFPPEMPWTPGAPAFFHYGPDLMNGMLAPPSGPDLAFSEELLSVYAWISLFLVVVTAIWRRASGLSVLIVIPLLLTASASVYFGGSFNIVQAPIPTGIPAAGIRASLVDIYWSPVELPHASYVLPNIHKPTYTWSYALMFVVLMRAAHTGGRSWPAMLTLAALIGFMSFVSTSLVPIVFALWAGLEAVWVIESRRAGSMRRSDMIRSASGLALAGLLVLAGSFSSILLDDDLVLAWNESFANQRLFGTVDWLNGGVGVLGLGPVAVAGVGVLLARRDRLVLALAAGAGMLVLLTLLTSYEPNPSTIARFYAHARNLALFSFMLALGIRLAGLRPVQWRYAAGAAVIALISWPTAADIIRNAGAAVGRNGIEFANSQTTQKTARLGHRIVLTRLPSERISTYIRDNTEVDARVFSPHPIKMTFATGRPNASGFAGLVHRLPAHGTLYRDVFDHLEPAAIQRRGFEFIHAPDEWVEGLPDEAVERLNDPRLFELLVRDQSESLYRVLPPLLSLDPPPAPASYEALRRAVPASATVYLLRPREEFDVRPLTRTAWALSHARLLGHVDRGVLDLVTPIQTEPLGNNVPDLIIAPVGFSPWMFPAAARQPIWWNDESAAYALDGAVDPIMPPRDKPLPFSVRVSDLSAMTDGRITFTATFDDRAPGQWSGQDWIVIAVEAAPWDLPTKLLPNATPPIEIWFAGLVGPGSGQTSLAYELDFNAPGLAARREHGGLEPLDQSEGVFDSGNYLLAVRLRHEYKSAHWRDAAIIPVLRIVVSETGEVSYQVHEDSGG